MSQSKKKTMFEDAKKLEAMEKEGQALYTQIVQEGKDNNQAVKEKLTQAIKNTEERGKIINKEKEALKKAQEEMKSVDKYVKKIEDSKLKEKADKVNRTYEKRHESFKKDV